MNRQETVYQLERSFRTVFRKFKHDINNLLGDNLSSNEFIVIKLLLDRLPWNPGIRRRYDYVHCIYSCW